MSTSLNRSEKEQSSPPFRRRRFGLIVTAVALSAALVWLILDLMFVPGQSTRALQDAIASAEKQGLAARIETLQRKYPSTPEGQKAIHEIARILPALKWNFSKAISAPGDRITSDMRQ